MIASSRQLTSLWIRYFPINRPLCAGHTFTPANLHGYMAKETGSQQTWPLRHTGLSGEKP